MFSDAEETSGTGTDTRSSLFPKRCRFGACPSVITEMFNTRQAANKVCHDSSVYVCVTNVCAASACGWRWVASNQVCASLISMCALTDNGCFAWLVMMFFFGAVGGVGSLSITNELVPVFPTSAEQTCGQDNMRHFLREDACLKRNHFVATGNPKKLESAAPDSCFKSLRATVQVS